MRAEIKRFNAEDFRKTEKVQKFFGGEEVRDLGVDGVAYYNAIRDFLTKLGPSKIIGIQTPGVWYKWQAPVTDVWYWVD